MLVVVVLEQLEPLDVVAVVEHTASHRGVFFFQQLHTNTHI